MAKLASKQKRIADIADMLEVGMERKQILQKLSKTFKGTSRVIDSEIKEAKLIVTDRNKVKEAIRLEQTSAATKAAVNKAIISDLEVEAILCTIITGNIKVEEIVKGKAILRSVSPMEQIAAADKIFKKRGSYAPEKKELSGTIQTPFSDSNVEKILQTIRQKKK